MVLSPFEAGRVDKLDERTAARVGTALEAWVTVRGDQATRSAEAGRAQQGRRSSVTGGLHLSAIGVSVPFGKADPIFQGASYLERMAIMCRRMRDTGLFDLAWAVAVVEAPFSWRELDPEVGWLRFSSDLRATFTQ